MLDNLKKYQIILASNSPRRKELMSGLGVDYVVRTLPDVDESYPDTLVGAEIPEYIAREKADAYRTMMQPGELLITADTIVWMDGKVLGKPEGREGAIEMLRALSGKSHQVFTGVCLTTTEWQKSFTASSEVLFDVLSEDEIQYYVDLYQPMDKAEKILELLDQAREKKAIIYYDPNFRSSHKNEAIKLAPTIIENLEYADIVRGSLEDFLYMYNIQDVDKIYKDKIKFYCPRFICTAGGEKVALRTNLVNKDYPVEPLQAVSTIGAGDNFNAGLIYGLLKYDVRYRDLNNLNEDIWDKIIQCGKDFAAEVCGSFSNSVSVEFAKKYR